jgi:hypothetical protein
LLGYLRIIQLKQWVILIEIILAFISSNTIISACIALNYCSNLELFNMSTSLLPVALKTQVNRLASIVTAVTLPLGTVALPALLLTGCDEPASQTSQTVVGAKYTTLSSGNLSEGLPVKDLIQKLSILENSKSLVSTIINNIKPSDPQQPPTARIDRIELSQTVLQLAQNLKQLGNTVENAEFKFMLADIKKTLTPVEAPIDAAKITIDDATLARLLDNLPKLNELAKILQNDIDALKPGQEVSTYLALSDSVITSKSAVRKIGELVQSSTSVEKALASVELTNEVKKLETATAEILKLSSNPGADKLKDQLALVVSYNQSVRGLCDKNPQSASAWLKPSLVNSNQQSLAEKIIAGALSSIQSYQDKVTALLKTEDPYGHLVQKQQPEQLGTSSGGTPQANTSTAAHSGGSSFFHYYPWIFNSGGSYHSGSTYHSYSGYHSASDGLRSVPKEHFSGGGYGKGYGSGSTGIKAGSSGATTFKSSGSYRR